MEKFNEKAKKKVNEVNTFPISYTLGEIKKNITISSKNVSKPSKEQIINQAFKFHSEGNISEAVKYYQYSISQGVHDHRIFSNYGNILRDIGQFKEAEKLHRKAIELNPNFANALYNHGNTLINLGQYKEAELSLRKAIKLNPNFAEAHLNLGNLLKDLGNLQEAELSTREAIKVKPDYAMGYLNLGKILRSLGNLQEAELSTRKAIEINPYFPDAYLNLGSLLIDIGKLKDAETANLKAIELNPSLTTARFNLGQIFIYLGKLKELILLSESTLVLKSINEGDKLQAFLGITIANLIEKDFTKTLINLNKTNELINQGAINIIKDETNRKHSSTFTRFINSLFPLLNKDNNILKSEKIPHFGESHCLSFAHQTLTLSSELKTIQPVLITGSKAWHFANKKNNQWKDSLNQQIKNHTYSQNVFISFGEIDCRKDEGILTYTIKKDQDIYKVCESTIKGYLSYMEKILSSNYSKRYYFGIPAPTRKTKLPDELDIKRIKMIKIYNLILKKEVLFRDSYFVDVYELTSNKNGENNNIHMCDDTHLSPKCLSTLFENYLYEP